MKELTKGVYMNGNNLFDKYVNLIRKRAWEYSKKYGIDFDEMESQGFLIYCECLKKYDITKSGFCTYLHIQLNRLNDFGLTYTRQRGSLIQDYFSSQDDFKEKNYEQEIESKNDSLSMNELLEDAKESLSDEAFQLLTWIVKREWERKNKRTPTIAMAVKKFQNVSKEIIEQAWNELSVFWNREGFAYYV